MITREVLEQFLTAKVAEQEQLIGQLNANLGQQRLLQDLLALGEHPTALQTTGENGEALSVVLPDGISLPGEPFLKEQTNGSEEKTRSQNVSGQIDCTGRRR